MMGDLAEQPQKPPLLTQDLIGEVFRFAAEQDRCQLLLTCRRVHAAWRPARVTLLRFDSPSATAKHGRPMPIVPCIGTRWAAVTKLVLDNYLPEDQPDFVEAFWAGLRASFPALEDFMPLDQLTLTDAQRLASTWPGLRRTAVTLGDNYESASYALLRRLPQLESVRLQACDSNYHLDSLYRCVTQEQEQLESVSLGRRFPPVEEICLTGEVEPPPRLLRGLKSLRMDNQAATDAEGGSSQLARCLALCEQTLEALELRCPVDGSWWRQGDRIAAGGGQPALALFPRLRSLVVKNLPVNLPRFAELRELEVAAANDRSLLACEPLLGQLSRLTLSGYGALSSMQLTDNGLGLVGRLCTALTSLSLLGCDSISAEGLASILRGCTALTHLGVPGESVCSLPHVQAQRLRSLVLSAVPLSDICKVCSGLEALTLWQCSEKSCCSDEGVALLVQTFPTLSSLTLMDATELSDMALEAISSLTGLSVLNITGCQRITEAGVAALGKGRCRGLRHVELWGCDSATAAGLEGLRKLLPLQLVLLHQLTLRV